MDYEDSVFNAFMLSFDKPIVHDYVIPSRSDCVHAILAAVYGICGFDKTKRRYGSWDDEILQGCSLMHHGSIPKKLLDGIYSLMAFDKEYQGPFEQRLGEDWKLRGEWFYGYGELYAWRSTEIKQTAEVDVKRTFNGAEKAVILLMQKIIHDSWDKELKAKNKRRMR